MRRVSPGSFASVFGQSDSETDYRALPNHGHQTMATKATGFRRCSQLICQSIIWQILFLIALTISLFFSALVYKNDSALCFPLLRIQTNEYVLVCI